MAPKNSTSTASYLLSARAFLVQLADAPDADTADSLRREALEDIDLALATLKSPMTTEAGAGEGDAS